MNTTQEQIQHKSHRSDNKQIVKKSKDQLILCEHCRRTATNGIKCQGIWVANSSHYE
jgi:hypothetical protein